MTTGETANGRSMSASSSALPRKRPRTSASAAITPKIVFSGTAIAATSIVSQNAWIAAGVVIESQTGADAVLERAVEDQPDRHEQQQRQVAERDDAQPDPRCAAQRSCAATTRPSARIASSTTSESSEQHDRHRGRARRVVALDLLEDEDRRDLRLERDVARRSARSSRTRRPRGRSASAAPDEDRRHQVGQDDPARRRRRRGARATRRPPPSRGRARSAPAAPSARRTAASRTAAPAATAALREGDVDADRAVGP